jgi:hypothetical protein
MISNSPIIHSTTLRPLPARCTCRLLQHPGLWGHLKANPASPTGLTCIILQIAIVGGLLERSRAKAKDVWTRFITCFAWSRQLTGLRGTPSKTPSNAIFPQPSNGMPQPQSLGATNFTKSSMLPVWSQVPGIEPKSYYVSDKVTSFSFLFTTSFPAWLICWNLA